jgi:nucleoid-associated protein YgaU
MASRYENNETKKLNDGRVVYKSKLYPKIPKSDQDIYIVTQTGDRLDTLASQFYENASLWWIIASANNVHDAPFALPDGTELRIPMNYVSIMNNFNK